MAEPSDRCALVVEDDPGILNQMRWCLAEHCQVQTASNRDDAIAALRRFEPDVVTLDLGLPPDPGGSSEGFAVLEEILRLAPATKVIVVTGREEEEHAIRAIAAGAFDYYPKPLNGDTLVFVVERALRIRGLERENQRLQASVDNRAGGIIGSSDAMQRVAKLIDRIGPTDVTTLVQGDTGTGKELVARALHQRSPRVDGAFVAINCAAIPENLLESELFGYEKGAFTGASAQKLGKVEHADGGTLFLDEIGDMPVALQSKMLRFLQERCVERIGGRQSIDVDVRVICATHRDLKAMVADQSFREDLYYRISEIVIRLPPLSERDGDSVLLASALLRRYADEFKVSNARFSDEAVQAISTWNWPGNVREMENRVKRAVILADSSIIGAEDLELESVDGNGEIDLAVNLRRVREDAEQRAIRKALALSSGNISRAAQLLGITRPTLYSLMSKLGIESEGAAAGSAEE